MRITIQIEHVVVDAGQPWSGDADTLAAATQAELGRLAKGGAMKLTAAARPGVVEGPRMWITSANGEPIPRQLSVSLQRLLEEVMW